MRNIFSYVSWKRRIVLAVLGILWALLPLVTLGIALGGPPWIAYIAAVFVFVGGFLPFIVGGMIGGGFFNLDAAVIYALFAANVLLWAFLFNLFGALAARRKARKREKKAQPTS